MADEIFLEDDFDQINVVCEKDESLWDKTKATASKAWNSKPGKVIKGIGLVAVGAIGALALAGRSHDDVIDEEGFNEIISSDDVEVTEF